MQTINIFDYIKTRKAISNKGTYGKTLIIGGSTNYPGSIIIASSAALKCGAGYVCICTLEEVYKVIACTNPEVIYEVLKNNSFYDEEILSRCLNYTSILFGNGMVGSNKELALDYLLRNYRGKLIIDAGGFDVLKAIGLDKLKESKAKVILTPHLKEFSKLFDVDITNLYATDLKDICKNIASTYGVVIDLKDYKSIITDGVTSYLIDNGNAGLAKAGSGDMLAGMIASFIAYMDYPLVDVVYISHYIMNEAATLASKDISLHSLTASDVIKEIGVVIKKYENSI